MFAHFKGLRLLFLSNFPEATFIQGATFIPDSRVCTYCIVMPIQGRNMLSTSLVVARALVASVETI